MRNIIMKEMSTAGEIRSSYAVMSELCDHLSINEYTERVEEMRTDGYRLFGLYSGEELVALAGAAIRMDLFNGRHLWIYELVTAAVHRSQGYGNRLVEELEHFAKQAGCEKSVLYSGLSRAGAHNFWEAHMRYEKRGYVFKKEL